MEICFSINKKNVYDIFIVVGLFCIIYNPPILNINSMHIIGAISWVYIICSTIIGKRIHIAFLVLLGVFLFFSFYVIAVISMSRIGDFDRVYNYIYFLLDIIPYGYMLKLICINHNYSVSRIFHLFIVTGLIQSFIIISAFLSADLHELIIRRFISYGYPETIRHTSNVRMYGFAAGLTYSTPIFQCYMSLLTMYFAILRKKKVYVLIAAILAFSGIINARVSFIVIGVGCLIFLFDKTINKNNKVVLVTALLIVGFLTGIVFFTIVKNIMPDNYKWLKDGLKEIADFINGNVGEGYFSYISDKEHFKIPNSIENIIWGTGDHVFGEKSMEKNGWSSDVGYINDLWIGGIVYMLLYYGFYLKIFFSIRRSRIVPFSYGALLCIILYPILLIKGSIYNMNDITNTMIIIYMLFCVKGISDGKSVCCNNDLQF